MFSRGSVRRVRFVKHAQELGAQKLLPGPSVAQGTYDDEHPIGKTEVQRAGRRYSPGSGKSLPKLGKYDAGINEPEKQREDCCSPPTRAAHMFCK